MPKAKVTDVLIDPAIRSHTDRILALQAEERQTRKRLGEIIDAIGAELIAAKEALDKTPDKTAWQRWLKGHVHYSAAERLVDWRVETTCPGGYRADAQHRVEMAGLGYANCQGTETLSGGGR